MRKIGQHFWLNNLRKASLLKAHDRLKSKTGQEFWTFTNNVAPTCESRNLLKKNFVPDYFLISLDSEVVSLIKAGKSGSGRVKNFFGPELCTAPRRKSFNRREWPRERGSSVSWMRLGALTNLVLDLV